MHKVKSLTALWSCLLSHILHQDLPGNLGGNRVLGWVGGGVFFSIFHTCATYYWCDWTYTKLVRLDTKPFALPGPQESLDDQYLGLQTLFKPWKANLPEKEL